MPTFEIPDGPTTVDLKRTGDANNPGPATGSVVFTVKNSSTDTCEGRLSVVPLENSKKEWFAIDGDAERNVPPGQTTTATIKVSVPKEVAAGNYPFRLRAVAVNDPDNDHAEGPAATAKVPGAQPDVHHGIPWWVWLLIGLVVVALIGGGAYIALRPHPKPPTLAPTPAPTPAAATVPKFIGTNVDAIASDANGYQIIKNETANTNRPPRIVYDQDPKPDTPLPAGQKVIVSYEPGLVVPNLPAGATFASAPNTLRAAGLQPGNFVCDRAVSGTGRLPVGTVTGFEPGPGSHVAANSAVNMVAVQAAACPTIIFIHPEVFLQTPIAKSMSSRQKSDYIRSIEKKRIP